MKRLLITCFSLFFIQYLFAQVQNNNWYFCRNNGLSFASGDPVIITGGQVDQWEGASSEGKDILVISCDRNFNMLPR